MTAPQREGRPARPALPAPTSHALALAAFLIGAFAVGFSYPSTRDPDIWWHLKTGEWIVQHGAVPWRDPFGAGTGGVRWVAYSWLAEVWFFLLDRHDPALGLKWLQGLVAAATASLLYVHARGLSGRPRLALLTSAFFLIPLVPWVARPHIFSFMLTAATMLLLWWGQNRARRALWLIPPVMVLWANLHIYFIVGLGLVWLVLLWPWLLWLFRDGRGRRPPPVAGLLVALAATLAPLLNPYGPALYGEVLPLAAHASANWPLDVIEELQSPNFHGWIGQILFIWLALLLLAFTGLGRMPAALTLALFLVLLFRALFAIRDIPYFVIVMLPLLAEHMALARPKLAQPVAARTAATHALPASKAWVHRFVALGLAALPVLLVANYGQERERLIQAREQGYPAGAAAYLRQYRPAGPLLNDFDWGGYLIHALHPLYPVYIDGRNQLYGRALWENYDALRKCKDGWSARLDATGARVVLWHRDAPLSQLLRLSPAWSVRHESGEAVVFVKNAPPRLAR